MAVKSIQVQTTRHETTKKDGTIVTAVSKSDESATHWSVYIRREDGEAFWVNDFAISRKKPDRARYQALAEAAHLSMANQVPIEKMF